MSQNKKQNELKESIKIIVLFKENKMQLFGKWKKKIICIFSDKTFRIFSNESAFNLKKSEITQPCSKIEIREIEKPSKPGAFLITFTNTKASYLVAPIVEENKINLKKIRDDFRIFKESIVEFGGSELEKISKATKKGFLDKVKSIAPEIPISSLGSFRSRVEQIPVEKWTVDDVQEWLGYIRNTDGKRMKELFGQLFLENDINGEFLVVLNDQAIKDMGIKSLGKRLKLLKEIKKLKEKRTYNLNEHFVMEKFEKMNPKWLKSIGNLEERVETLCNVESIKKTYLNSDKYKMVDIQPVINSQKEAEETEEKEQEENENENENENADTIIEGRKSNMTYDELIEDSVVEGDEIADIAKVLSDKSYKEQQLQRMNEQNKMKGIPIKLIITEIMHTKGQKRFRSWASPFVGGIPSLSGKFGMFHTALVVGPWYLEWTDSSLCIPKKISSSMAILALDVEPIFSAQASLAQVSDKLAQLIVDWNVNFQYKNISGLGIDTKKKMEIKEGNCQDFVLAVLQKLNVEPNFQGSLKKFLKEMRMKGTAELVFRPTKEFRQACDLTEKSYSFENHEVLDQFVINLKLKNPTFQIDFPNEDKLLKAFDRGFWVRHFKNPEHPKYKPLMGVNSKNNAPEIVCPFKDPRVTGTMHPK